MNEFSQYEGKTVAQVVSLIRKESMTMKQKWRAIQRHVKRVELSNGRQTSLVECQKCFALVRRDEAECHHLNEVGQLASTAPADIEAYRERVFVHASLLAPYCFACHQQHHHKN